MKRRHFLITAAAVVARPSLAADAQFSFAGKQIRVVVPYVAGGVADATARIALEGLQSALGAAYVVIENRPGANGNIGTEYVARQPADGTHYLVIPSSQITTNAFVPELRIKNVDVLKQFVPVAPLADIPLALVVQTGSGIDSFSDFMRRAKASELRFGNPGVGTPHHLAALLLEKHAGLRFIHAPYKGGTPMVADLAGGHIDAAFSSWNSVHTMIAAGKLKAIGSLQSGPAFGGLRSLNAEAGGTPLPTWTGVFASAGTPERAMEAVNKAVQAALRTPQVDAKYRELGLVPMPLNREESAAKLKDEARFMESFLGKVKLDFKS